MLRKIFQCFTCLTTSTAINDQSLQPPLTSCTSLRIGKDTSTQSSINKLRVLTTYALASQYDNSDSGIVVLGLRTCGGPKRERDLCSTCLVYHNVSACGIYGSTTEHGDGGILAVLAQSEPNLLRDVHAHLVRLAVADQAGSLSLYLEANKYCQAGQSCAHQLSCTATSSLGYTAGNSACGGGCTRPASSRRWLHAIVEPVMVILGASAGTDVMATNAPSGQASVLHHPSHVGEPQVPAEAHGGGEGRKAFPAVVVTFVMKHAQNSSNRCEEPQSSVPRTQSPADVHEAPSPAFPPAIGNAAIGNAGRSLEGSAADLRMVPGYQVSLHQPGASGVCAADLFISELFKPREGMVLAGLTSIITAFTFDRGSATLYQNGLSILYYGVRTPSRPARDTGGAEEGDMLTSGAPSILEELFCFEPVKLQCMLADICSGDRVWRGLVQVPVSCNPALSAFQSRGEASMASMANGRQQLATATASLLGTQQLVPQPPEQLVRPHGTAPSVGTSHPPGHGRRLFSAAPVMVPSAAVACWSINPSSSACLRVFKSAAVTDNPVTFEAVMQQLATAKEGDLLATSTWGLMVGKPEQWPCLDTHASAEETTEQESQPSEDPDGGSCDGSTVASTRASVSPSLFPCQSKHPAAGTAKTAAVGSARYATAGTNEASASSTSFVNCPLLAGVSTAGDKGMLSQPQRSSCSRFISDSDLVFGAGAPGVTSAHNGEQGGSTEMGPGGNEAEKQQRKREPRAVSMRVAFSPDRNRSVMQRSLSRVDRSFTASVPRVLTFASSLKKTPFNLQAVLQQQARVSGSRHGQSKALEDGVPPCRENFNSLPSSPLCEQVASSPFPMREGRSWRVYAEAAAQLAATSEKEAALQPRPAGVSSQGGHKVSQRRAAFCLATSKPAAAHESSLVCLDEHTPLHQASEERFGGMHDGMAAIVEQQAPPMTPSTAHSTAPGAGLGYCWHEVSASRCVDPVTGQPSIVMAQVDVTAKVEAERHLASVTEAEHRLLEQVFPRHVLAYMTEEVEPWPVPVKVKVKGDPSSARKPPVRDVNALATTHALVTLLFADIQGFTPMCKVLEPRVVMAFLNDLFSRFDQLLDEFGVYKVETIGDCYFVAGGLIHHDEQGMSAVRASEDQADPHHALNVFHLAQAMLEAAAQVTLPTTGEPVQMRIGIHSGPVVSGVVGQRMPRFCLFGDTVNTASRMESSGVPGCIHASEDAWRLLQNQAWVPTDGIQVKGKGPMNTFLWAPPDSRAQVALAQSIIGSAANQHKAAGSNSSSHAQRGTALPPAGAATGGASKSSAAGSGRQCCRAVASSMPSFDCHTSSVGGEDFDPFLTASSLAQIWPLAAAAASCGSNQVQSVPSPLSPDLDLSVEPIGLCSSMQSSTS